MKKVSDRVTSYKYKHLLVENELMKTSCLKQDKASYNDGTIVNIYIVYEISKNYNINSYPTLENYLFGAVSLSKHASDID